MAFGKKNKSAEETVLSHASSESNVSREQILSAWAIDPFLQKNESATDTSDTNERKGFLICRKCFEVIAAQDVRCSHCGAANNRS